MTRLLPLLLLAACSRPAKPDPTVRDLLHQLANVCAAYDNAVAIAQMDTVTVEPLREWHSQADALCSGVAVPDTLVP